jgi:PAS domain S-box-containing protein
VLVRVRTAGRAVRVEVEDRGLQAPSRRSYSDSSGTGRGLAMVEDTVRSWGVEELEDGKVVWFEVGDPEGHETTDGTAVHEVPDGTSVQSTRTQDVVRVRLQRVPLLMHVAWQEHAAALLREHLLHSLGDDGGDVLSEHAHASEAMSLLYSQLPVPVLGAAPEELMAGATEPLVTAEDVVLEVPLSTVAHFATLDRLLRRSLEEARAGHFLCPPTQPEIEEMRRWLCSEVARQAAGDTTEVPWVARSDVRVAVVDRVDGAVVHELHAEDGEALVATDESSVVVAVSPAAVELLGYASAEDLLGRRVIAIVPERFRQAHIAGTTLHATNGRDNLLGVPVRVPMVRADGSEVDVELRVDPEAHDEGPVAFVARFRAV